MHSGAAGTGGDSSSGGGGGTGRRGKSKSPSRNNPKGGGGGSDSHSRSASPLHTPAQSAGSSSASSKGGPPPRPPLPPPPPGAGAGSKPPPLPPPLSPPLVVTKEPPAVKKRHSRTLVLDALEDELGESGEIIIHHDSEDEDDDDDGCLLANGPTPLSSGDPAPPSSASSNPSSGSSSGSSSSGGSDDEEGERDDDDDSSSAVPMPPRPPVGNVNRDNPSPGSVLRKRGGGGGHGPGGPVVVSSLRMGSASAPNSTGSLASLSGPGAVAGGEAEESVRLASGGGGGGPEGRPRHHHHHHGHVGFAMEEVTTGGGGGGGGGGRRKKRRGGGKGGKGKGDGGGGGGESDGSSIISPPTLAGGGRMGTRAAGVGEDGGGWGSMLWGTSYGGGGGAGYNIHSMYQSVMGRKFSFILETEDRVFWSTLLSGFSVLPLFMLVFTACSNTAMGILFSAVAETPYAHAWHDWVRLALSTLGTMIALRNLLVSMYEMTMDNTAPYPLLNPTLLSRIRSIVAVRPRGLATLVTVLHVNSSLTLWGLTYLGVKMGNLPTAWTAASHVFLYNLLIKLAAWRLFLLYERWLKRRARRTQQQQQQQHLHTHTHTAHKKPPAKPKPKPTTWSIFGGSGVNTGGNRGRGGSWAAPLGAKQVTFLRRLRRGVVWYYALSDLVLIGALAVHYLWWGEGQELLRHQQMAGHDPHLYDELERRVVAFNCMALVISNFASLAAWTYEVLTYGAHVLERARWSDSIAASRQVSLYTTLALYLLSLLRHGFLPAFFTLLVVFNGLSLSKVVIWSCIEVHRTLLPLLGSLRRHPLRACGVLLAYILATRTPSDALLLTMFVAAVFWAVKVQLRPHLCDIWAVGLTSLAVFMAVHTACYNALGPRLDLFNVTLTDTHLNISSLVGPMSMELLPPPGSSSAGGRLFHRLMKQNTAFFSSSPSSSNGGSNGGFHNPVAEAKRAEPKYPFCQLRPHGHALTLMEYAAFSFLAYLEKDSKSFDTFFKAAFDPTEWTIMRGPEPRPHGAVFLDAYNARMNLSVVATRGTNPKNLFDVFQDMVLFNGAFCWDMVGQLVPLVRWIPGTWTSNILYLAYLPLQLRFQSVAGHKDLALHYHPEIQDYVEAISRERQVVLTGHSLGGGLGKIVSAKLGIPIVAISAPGVYLSHKIFDIPRANIDRYEVNLMAPEDVVPMVDRLRGITLQMQCHRENPLDCHNLGITLCDLYEKCGLPFQRGSAVGDRILGCAHP